MFHLIDEFDRAFSSLDELRRQFDSAFATGWPSRRRTNGGAQSWPRANVFDSGTALVVTAEIPGVSQDSLDIQLHDGTLTISGERKEDAPEGYSVHRRERGPVKFSRSFALPTRVDAEKVSAKLENGVLEVELAKAADAQPRQISVKSS